MTASSTYAEYDRLPGIRWSVLKWMRISPKHYLWHRDHPEAQKETPAIRFGRAVDCLVIEPDAWEGEFAVWPGARRGNAWKEFASAHVGQTILAGDEFVRVKEVAAAVLCDPHAAAMMHRAARQRAIQWTDAETGLQCKGLCDLLGGRLADLKTTGLDLSAFWRWAYSAGYAAQLAYYSDGLAAELGGQELACPPALIVAETSPPYDVLVMDVGDVELDAGRNLYRRLLRRVAECEASGEWPGQAPSPIPYELPSWAPELVEMSEPITLGGREIF